MARIKLIRRVVVTLVAIFLAVPGLTCGKGAIGAMTTSEPDFHRVSQDSQLLQTSAAVMSLQAGFLCWPWGTQSSGLAGIKYITDIAPNLAVYSVDEDVSSLLGTVDTDANPRLVFDKDEGLVLVHVDFDGTEYNLVQKYLTQLLGEGNSIIYELRAAKVDFGDYSEWRVGQNTRLVLVSHGTDAYIEISKRNFFLSEGRDFTQEFAMVVQKQAEMYKRQNRILQASSACQELLNSTRSYHFFTQTASEELVRYSRLPEAVDYLGEDGGVAVCRLKNTLADSDKRLWVRIDLDAVAQEALQQQRPAAVELTDKLIDIRAVLCRVKLAPDAGKYIVMEQIWLDGLNQIIGGRRLWAPQAVGWPVIYIKSACETFMEGWLTVGSTRGSAMIFAD
ncbi:MAG: hypothetical protein H6Q68_2807 [Firmicutes bacterium]|nr:hypothetical protein [Bacillota bacterium]